MKFRERIESNPITVIVSVIIVTAGVTASVIQFFAAQVNDAAESKSAVEISRLEDALAKIPRTTPAERAIDVTSLIVSRSARTSPSSGGRFFPDWNLYALADESSWHHRETNKRDWLLQNLDVDESMKSDLKSRPEMEKLHVWSLPDSPAISIGPILLRSNIVIRRTSMRELLEQWKGGLSPALEQLPHWLKTEVYDAYDARKIDPADYSPGEAASISFLLGWQISMSIKSKYPKNINAEVLDVRKIGSILHATTLITFKDVEVDGTNQKAYFMRIEYFVFARDLDTVIVTAQILSDNPLPRGKAFSRLTEWLGSFAVLED